MLSSSDSYDREKWLFGARVTDRGKLRGDVQGGRNRVADDDCEELCGE